MRSKFIGYLRDRIRSDDVVDFGQFRLHINPRDIGGRAYRAGSYRDELHCPLQREIIARLRPSAFIDIGANYGFTSLAHRANNPGCSLIAVEPSPGLLPYLRRNLGENARTDFTVLPSLCGDHETDSMSFALNPRHSQDNRVTGESGWPTVPVSAVTLASIIETQRLAGPLFVKIDTQGFEEKVFQGGWSVLTSRDDWMIKTEFAPAWLRKQGTAPDAFLRRLADAFCVSEWPKRASFKGHDLRSLSRLALTSADVSAFVTHTAAFANGEGWCDLLVQPAKAFSQV